MFKYLFSSALVLIFASCGNPEETADNSQHGTEKIEDSLSIHQDTLVSDLQNESTQNYIWTFIEGKTELGELQTDLGLLLPENNFKDTIKFFTTRGKWSELSITENGINDFPENCLTAVESKAESCFWAVRLKEEGNYEVLFGGIEDKSAFAVLNYGYIQILNNEVEYEVGDPEEVETYTQYGSKLY